MSKSPVVYLTPITFDHDYTTPSSDERLSSDKAFFMSSTFEFEFYSRSKDGQAAVFSAARKIDRMLDSATDPAAWKVEYTLANSCAHASAARVLYIGSDAKLAGRAWQRVAQFIDGERCEVRVQ